MPTELTQRPVVQDGARALVFLYPQDESTGYPSYEGGYLEPLLNVVNCSWRIGRRTNTAIIDMSLGDWLGWNEGEQVPQIRAEEYYRYVQENDIIEIVISVTDADGETLMFPIFVGFLTNPKISIYGRGKEKVTFTAVGFDHRLNDLDVRGQTVAKPNIDAEIMKGTIDDNIEIGWVGGREEPDFDDPVIYETVGVDTPLIFNPDGRPNASTMPGHIVTPNGESVTFPVFQAVDRNIPGMPKLKAKHWTLADAVKYILYCYNNEAWVRNPTADYIDAVFGDTPINNIDLRGVTKLKDVLTKLFENTKYTFAVAPMPIDALGEGGYHQPETGINEVRCQLYFIEKNRGPFAFLGMAIPGTSIINAYDTNTNSLVVTRELTAARNEIIVVGDYYYYQYMFEYSSYTQSTSDLIEAWDYDKADIDQYFNGSDFITVDDDEEVYNQFIERHSKNGKSFQSYQDCFRTFALNESGKYYNDSMVYNAKVHRATPHRYFYSFNHIFGNNQYQVKQRRFYKPIEKTIDGSSDERLQPVLMLSFDSGTTYFPFDQFAVSDDECKITITASNLLFVDPNDTAETPKTYITALQNSTLRMKLYACVKSDARMTLRAKRLENSHERFTVQHTISDQKLRNQSIAGDSKLNVSAETELVNHELEAATTALHNQEMLQDGFVNGNPIISGINFQYEPGMRLESIQGRNIPLTTNKGGNTRYPTIVGIKYTFGTGAQPKHMTELEIDRAAT